MANAPEYQKYDYNADYEQAKKEQQKAQDAAYNSAVSELKDVYKRQRQAHKEHGCRILRQGSREAGRRICAGRGQIPLRYGGDV